ncbi:histidine phosphatase family protein [Salinicola corii]|uniref:Histidine phosphatase family protein n=1 Tax=Salinicola corii TaxID=2606937 RepID=A0A640W7N3_9GAMM|nr:histidine phosphatase family protein [Salinicola corii]KAA0015598.1 histidine phosphatase family protein [Salinicola corii]
MIYLMRHGETSFNVEGRLLGQTNIPLCPIGVENVKQTAKFLRNLKIGVIFSSPYLRAIQTADILASATGTMVRVNKDFRERNLGIMDGQYKNSPEWAALVARLGEKEFIPPEGEPVDACIGRFSRALEFVTKGASGNVLIVSHGGVISLYMRYILRVESEQSFLDNCAFHALDTGAYKKSCVEQLNTSFL